ncbi:sensor histidine kinase [Alteromonas halophila]|uniref:histidine kinase n=1 Tax=Alteromonas halophila TaxID=516698 RepID=A0A918MXV6_9ALTE|nr:HAMP domain-containing sensor histidine kinase [Alteromonas halophila]GGW82816.1 two-component sensor histidine kinase [Alteromonas halophila]
MYKKKLFIFGFLASFILLVALACAAVTAQLTRTNLKQSIVAQTLLTEHQQLSSISYRLFKQLTDELIFGKDANQAKVRNKKKQIDQSLEKIRSLELRQRQALGKVVTAGSVEDTDELASLINNIIAEFRTVAASDTASPLNQRAQLQLLLEDTIDNQFREAINAAVVRQNNVVTAINASIDTLNTTIVWFTLGLGVVSFPFIILGCFWLFNALYQPLTVIKSGTQAIAEGNYDYRIPAGFDDEFNSLTESLNQLATRLAEHENQASAYRRQLEVEVEQRTRALTEANSRLTQIDARRRQFIADVSHELRTPLTIIRGEAQVTLRQDSQPNNVYRQTLEAILEQAVHLSGLVDDLLLLARAEMSQLKLDLQQQTIGPLIAQQLHAWQRAHESRHLVTDITPDVQSLTLYVDPQRIRQVLTILLDNANKYSPSDSQITVTATLTDAHVDIVVHDEGEGISASDIEHIFERFVRLKRQGNGMGLGLAIAKTIAEAHQGELLVSSTPGVGSAFTLRLPQDRVHESTAG